MSKFQNDLMLDAALSTIKQNVDLMCVCAGQPESYASAVGAQKLAQFTFSTNLFTLANGDVNGRKVTVSTVSGLVVSTTGGANHIVLLQTTGSVLWYGTTCTSQQLTAGNTLTVNGWDIEIADVA